MAVDKEAKRKATELKNLLFDRMVSEGYENVRKFHIESRIPLSPETVRRALSDVDYYKAMETSTLIIVCVHLNFKADEIREILVNYTDDKYFHKLIGKQPKEALSVYDEAIVKAVSEIVKANPEAPKLVADMLDFVAKGSGVDISEYSDKIRRRKV
ncbi:MAG: hypothetical protein ACLQVJ_05335 [Syntrophobacteraceae bacterium]